MGMKVFLINLSVHVSNQGESLGIIYNSRKASPKTHCQRRFIYVNYKKTTSHKIALSSTLNNTAHNVLFRDEQKVPIDPIHFHRILE